MPRRNFDRNILMALGAIIVVSVVVFWPCLRAPFVTWDDPPYLTGNLTIRTLTMDGIRRIFSSTVSATWIPLSVLSYAVEYHFFGLEAFPYHLDNFLLHVANVLLIFFLGRYFGLSVMGRLGAALLFAIHPMHVEAVAWVTSRKDVLYTLFYLLSIWAYARYVFDGKRSFLGISLSSGLLAMLAKPMALSLPLVLGLADWFWRRPQHRRLFLEKIPYFLYVIPAAWLTYRFHVRVPGTDIIESLLTWLWCLVFYLKKFLWPFPCLPLYSMPADFSHPEFVSAAVIFLILVVALIYRRRHRLWLFAFFFYFLSVFFLLRFDTAQDLQVVSDRYMYLPSLGLCLLFGLAVQKAKALLKTKIIVGRRAMAAAGIALTVAIGFYSFRQCRLWQNEEALWSHVIKYNPTAMPYQKLGDYYFLNGFEDKAFPAYKESFRLDPSNDEALINMAVIKAARQQHEAALRDLHQAQRLAPDYPPVYINRGIVYGQIKRYDLALQDLTHAIQLDPSSVKAYINRGNVYSYLEWQPSAIRDYNKAIRINRWAVQAYYNRGLAFARGGDFKKAESDFKKTLELDPTHPQAAHNLDVIRRHRARKGLSE